MHSKRIHFIHSFHTNTTIQEPVTILDERARLKCSGASYHLPKWFELHVSTVSFLPPTLTLTLALSIFNFIHDYHSVWFGSIYSVMTTTRLTLLYKPLDCCVWRIYRDNSSGVDVEREMLWLRLPLCELAAKVKQKKNWGWRSSRRNGWGKYCMHICQST